MKKVFSKAFIAGVFMIAYGAVNAQLVTLPRTPSPAAVAAQTIGISTVTVKYSRPSVKGRNVWGELVPYGWNVQPGGTANPAPWRAGANENTVITFSHPAKVEGQMVPAGSYGLFMTINNDDSGEVILSKDYQSWGNFFYDPGHDLMRAKIKIQSGQPTELLTYTFSNVTKNGAELDLNWEKKQFPVKIEFAVDDIVIANLEAELHGVVGFNWQAYNNAAAYTLQNNVYLDKGLAWINESMNRGGNNAFATFNIKAGILKKQGNADEATKTLTSALAIANENDLNNYGYQLLNQGDVDKAIEILALNTKRHPESANVWDSLGEAYATKGDKKNAITNFKKSLALNPPAGTKANSEKFLKQLGAM
jgi:predicted negative regulator of RcsB-dependent stress response